MKPLRQKKSLLPDLPAEIRAARIGTCFNSITRRLLPAKIAIDPTRLKEGSVEFVGGKGTLKLKANSSSDAASENTFFSIDSKIKTGCIFCSATINFKASTAAASASNNQTLNCYCSYVYTGQKLQLLDIGSNELYKCMRDEFQKAYTAVVKSKDATEYMTNFVNFINKFGHGCITELFLTSGSAFMIDAKFSAEQYANSYKYGSSVCISSPWGNGGSVASEYAKDIANSKAKAEMEFLAEQLPQDTPTKDWCNDLMNSLAHAQFEKLAKDPGLIKAYDGKGPDAPDIPKGTPSKEDEPDGEAIDISDELKEKIMDEDDFSGTWDEYMEAQKKAYEKLESSQIVKEIKSNKLSTKTSKAQLTNAVSEKDLQKEHQSWFKVADAWDLGGYIPFSYKITPWSDLFPELFEAELPTTFTSIYIAKLYIYYFTKLQFSSYLYFLADGGERICKNPHVSFDAGIYEKACNGLLEMIQQMIQQTNKITETDYQSIVSKFEKDVKHLSSFYSTKVYDRFYNDYDFFVSNSYGFILVRGNQYLAQSGYKNKPKPFGLLPMLKDAMRFYPIILLDGSLTFAFFPSSWGGADLKFTEKRKDEDGFYYYVCIEPDGKQCRQYGVGFKNIPDMKDKFYIRGLPMFDALPFDEIKEFAKPRPLGIKYPAYQLYKDNTGTKYCSNKKVKSHAEGSKWVKDCIHAHPGTSCSGKPWLSNSQSGTIWP